MANPDPVSGSPTVLHGITGGVDENNIATIVVPVWVPTLGDALSYEPAVGIDMPVVSRTISQSPEGGFIALLNYSGAGEDQTFDADSKTFELEGTMSDDPIATHPNFEELAAKYGWDYKAKEFPEFLPNKAKVTTGNAALGLQKKDSAKKTKNPLYTVSSYLAVGAELRISYGSRTVPEGAWKDIGAIFDVPPNIGTFVLPKTTKNRNWMKMAPSIKQRGNTVEITERYMMSGPAGWIPDMYNGAQLD